RAGLTLPDVREVGDVLELLGESTSMRVWYAGPQAFRVDALHPAGEKDLAVDGTGSWIWDSFEQRATRVEGESEVRLARPADLLPPELSRRMAAAATAEEVTRIPPRRVAGRAARGVRITPRSTETTIGRVDIWAELRTGLPLAVEVTTRTGTRPVIAALFLDLELRRPDPERVRFVPPLNSDVDITNAIDVAQEVDLFSPFLLPDRLDQRARRSAVGRGAGTYGDGFALVAVLTLPERLVRRARRDLDGPLTPTITGPWGEASLVETPLLRGMIFPGERGDGVGFAIAGTVTRAVLEKVATALTASPLATSG
ncbi:MAG TPA: hypothetical protein VNB94_12200, partial [Mycobacteriales bacterium]|nr:hypothetical protein [Mycobacteriales bacterium]